MRGLGLALPILWEQGECWTCDCVAVVYVGSGYGTLTRVWRGYVCVSLDYLCIWQVKVSVYCARRISAHLRCTVFNPVAPY